MLMSDAESDRDEKCHEMLVLGLAPALILALILMSWALAHWRIGSVYLNAALALVAVFLGGTPRFIAGFKDVFCGRITVNVFVTVALAATIAIGEFRPAAVIILIMSVVGALESYTLEKTRRSISDLLNLAPQDATVRRNGEEVTVAVAELRVGDRVVVRPGERIPVDGVVVAGTSSVNQAPITGESMPVEKVEGSAVFSGTLNESGRLEIMVEKVGEGTTLARIVHLVQDAQNTRAPIQNLADRFTTWFLPTVIVLAVLAYFVTGDFKAAVSVLLVACPCAFAIATPTAVTAGVSNLARRAILVKGGAFLELGHKIDHLLVDKTGTFTFGRPKVMEIVCFNSQSPDEVLRLACVAEKYSEHPLARAVLAAGREKGLSLEEPDQFTSSAGMGVKATWKGDRIQVGKPSFLKGSSLTLTPQIEQALSQQSELGRTPVLVARNDVLIGLLAIADEVRPEMPRAIRALREMGVKRITMLTGDNPQVAAAVARAIGIDNFLSELLPEQKQAFVKKCQSEGLIVGMVGDGVNDAPALALADVGIAMGAAGTDVAIEASDVTLMNDDLTGVAEFMWMSASVLRRIKMNIFFSMIYNIIGLTLSIVGLMTPIIAVIFQEAGCVTVVVSSTLLLWAKGRPASHNG